MGISKKVCAPGTWTCVQFNKLVSGRIFLLCPWKLFFSINFYFAHTKEENELLEAKPIERWLSALFCGQSHAVWCILLIENNSYWIRSSFNSLHCLRVTENYNPRTALHNFLLVSIIKAHRNCQNTSKQVLAMITVSFCILPNRTFKKNLANFECFYSFYFETNSIFFSILMEMILNNRILRVDFVSLLEIEMPISIPFRMSFADCPMWPYFWQWPEAGLSMGERGLLFFFFMFSS